MGRFLWWTFERINMTFAAPISEAPDKNALSITDSNSQIDIFGFESTATPIRRAPTVLTIASAPEKKSIGDEFKTLWQGYCQALTAYHAALKRLSAHEQRVAPTQEYSRAIRAQSEHTLKKLRSTVAKDMQRRLLSFAENQFAPPGTRLAIDIEKMREAVPENAGDMDKFDPGVIWKYLEANYCGSNGEEAAWRQAAAKFHDVFRLHNQICVKRSAGYVVLERYVTMDSHDKKWHGTNRLCHAGIDDAQNLYRSLIAFATWADRTALVHDLKHGVQHWARDTEIKSREKFKYGENAEVVVVTFIGTFEFRIKEALAEQLQIFLGTYLPK
jgi:hypothetical protein